MEKEAAQLVVDTFPPAALRAAPFLTATRVEDPSIAPSILGPAQE